MVLLVLEDEVAGRGGLVDGTVVVVKDFALEVSSSANRELLKMK